MSENPKKPVIEEITGTVGLLYYANPKFSAGTIWYKGRDAKFAVKGFVRAGQPVTLRGHWTTHEKYGRQFEAAEVVVTMPAHPDGLARWMEWHVPNLGPVKVRKLIDEFGTDVTRIAVENPEQIAIAVGIPITSVNELATAWVTQANKIIAATQLAAWGLTSGQCDSLIEAFGATVVEVINDDPYAVLGKAEGFGWKTTDDLAARLGVVGDDPRRIRGAFTAVVREMSDQGSTAVRQSVAGEVAAEKLGLNVGSGDDVANVIKVAIERGQIKSVAVEDVYGAEDWLCTPGAYDTELSIWKTVSHSFETNPHTVRYSDDGLKTLVESYKSVPANGTAVDLDAGQLRAVYAAARHRLSVVTGGAGAGKTLVARAITKFFTDADVDVMLCAPTGKAARRLTDVIGKEASTIHRLLGFKGDGVFDHSAKNPLRPGVVLCDEFSMADAWLTRCLFDSLGPHTTIVLIGDPNQLPPVGPGAPLRDVLAHDLAPITRLEGCHRQAGTLKRNCQAILRGTVEPWASDVTPSPWVVGKADTPEKTVATIEKMYAKFLGEWGYCPVKDTQFMTAQHNGKLGTKRLNLVLQRLHQKALQNDLGPLGADEHEQRPTLYEGDKVIHTKNNYELNVMNGTVGYVVETYPQLVVSYEDGIITYPNANKKEVSLAYCLTPHKMQGSEIPCAVTIVPKAHYYMQTRNWIYTATTRAQKTCVLLGDDEAIRKAAERVEADKRQTLLQLFATDRRSAGEVV